MSEIDVLEELRKMQLMMKDVLGTILVMQQPKSQDNSSRVECLENEVRRQGDVIKTLQRQIQASIDCHLRTRETLSALTLTIKKLATPS